eukprot:11559076-Alexandrium_andersonii.AAC.1
MCIRDSCVPAPDVRLVALDQPPPGLEPVAPACELDEARCAASTLRGEHGVEQPAHDARPP